MNNNNIFTSKKNKLYSLISSDNHNLYQIIDLISHVQVNQSLIILDWLFHNDNKFINYYILEYLNMHRSCNRFLDIFFNHRRAMKKIEISGIDDFNYKFVRAIYNEIDICRNSINKMRTTNKMNTNKEELERLYFIQNKIICELEFFFLYDALQYKVNKHLIFRIGEYL